MNITRESLEMPNKQTKMEVFVLLKGYNYEGFGSDVEVFSTRDAAEARRQAYRDGEWSLCDNQNPNITYDYGYDIIKNC